ETRLGLAMCGGVSLAIYINGVSNEFYRAVRGRGVYGLVKELTDSNIVVDILSGSSAGGLNAILLSAALCELMPVTSAAESGTPPLPELDLFITGTDVNGRRTPQVDAAGATVQIK